MKLIEYLQEKITTRFWTWCLYAVILFQAIIEIIIIKRYGV